eukprot:TRINITY_DN14402_c0_g1_i4.p1 TRINITY_DN14402_c0_g1~~TRINITY_DN14402_c0_g1_i4.p1  ORF type:complete len:204 (+),score=71.22 TRINITY_DN14402_c0_g1_i4:150-761(+)
MLRSLVGSEMCIRDRSKHREKEFLETYEYFTEYTVPRSAREVRTDDKDYKLFRIFHLNVPALEDDLKNSVEDKKFKLRPFVFEPQAAQQTSAEESELARKHEVSKKEVITSIRTNFSEMFMGWFHLKAIRVFVESVLWYSLPPNFQVMMITTDDRHIGGLRSKLASRFSQAKCSQANMTAEEGEENYPYVNLDLDLDWLFEEP